MIAVPFASHQLGLLLLATPLVIIARFAVVQPWAALYRFRQGERGSGIILGWGGLHGALSLALALTLPSGPSPDPVDYLRSGCVFHRRSGPNPDAYCPVD
jgi:CPA1 family monovalent cation:H+ antiporter